MSDKYLIQNEDRILRPVTLDDAEFIVHLRNQKHARGFIHETSSDVEKQRDWLRAYFQRDYEYYWIITTLDGIPYGTNSLYNFDKNLNQIETGRWITLPGFEGNLISGHIQMRDFVFDILNLDKVVMHVVSANKQVIRYQRDLLGNRVVGTVNHAIDESGLPIEETIFEETRESWKVNKARLMRFCGDTSKWKIFKQNTYGTYEEI